MTDYTFRTVAPVLAVCAAFAVQPSAYPPEASKPDVAPPCGTKIRPKPSTAGSVERGDAAELTRPAACGGARDMELASTKRRGRTKPRCRARPAAVTSARGAGSFGISVRGCCGGKNSPVGVRKTKSPAVSRKTAGLRTEIGGILAWQATKSSFRSG